MMGSRREAGAAASSPSETAATAGAHSTLNIDPAAGSTPCTCAQRTDRLTRRHSAGSRIIFLSLLLIGLVSEASAVSLSVPERPQGARQEHSNSSMSTAALPAGSLDRSGVQESSDHERNPVAGSESGDLDKDEEEKWSLGHVDVHRGQRRLSTESAAEGLADPAKGPRTGVRGGGARGGRSKEQDDKEVSDFLTRRASQRGRKARKGPTGESATVLESGAVAEEEVRKTDKKEKAAGKPATPAKDELVDEEEEEEEDPRYLPPLKRSSPPPPANVWRGFDLALLPPHNRTDLHLVAQVAPLIVIVLRTCMCLYVLYGMKVPGSVAR